MLYHRPASSTNEREHKVDLPLHSLIRCSVDAGSCKLPMGRLARGTTTLDINLHQDSTICRPNRADLRCCWPGPLFAPSVSHGTGTPNEAMWYQGTEKVQHARGCALCLDRFIARVLKKRSKVADMRQLETKTDANPLSLSLLSQSVLIIAA